MLSFARFVVAGLLATSLAACATGSLGLAPDTEPRRSVAEGTLRSYLAAYNDASRSEIEQFISARFAPIALEGDTAAQRAALIARTRQFTGPLTLQRVLNQSDHGVAALLQSSVTEEWFRLELAISSQPPYSVVRQSMEFSDAPQSSNPTPLSTAAIAAEARRFAAGLRHHFPFRGEVLMASASETILTWSAPAWQPRATPSGPFDIASVGKMFTSVAIAQLEEEGRLSLGEPVATYFPDYPNLDAAANVTIGHLLTHSSGLAEYMDDPAYQAAKRAAGGRLRRTSDYLPFFAAVPLLFRPGERISYTNSGYVLLGLIVERLTGTPFPNYVADRILRPSGMAETPLESIRPAGGEMSTASDLVKFGLALLQGRLLGPEQTRRVLSATPVLGRRNSYGLEAMQEGGVSVVGHGGGSPGVGARLDLFPDQGHVAAVVVEGDDAAARRLADKIRRLMVRRTADRRPAAAQHAVDRAVVRSAADGQRETD